MKTWLDATVAFDAQHRRTCERLGIQAMDWATASPELQARHKHAWRQVLAEDLLAISEARLSGLTVPTAIRIWDVIGEDGPSVAVAEEYGAASLSYQVCRSPLQAILRAEEIRREHAGAVPSYVVPWENERRQEYREAFTEAGLPVPPGFDPNPAHHVMDDEEAEGVLRSLTGQRGE